MHTTCPKQVLIRSLRYSVAKETIQCKKRRGLAAVSTSHVGPTTPSTHFPQLGPLGEPSEKDSNLTIFTVASPSLFHREILRVYLAWPGVVCVVVERCFGCIQGGGNRTLHRWGPSARFVLLHATTTQCSQDERRNTTGARRRPVRLKVEFMVYFLGRARRM
jgi:hypothetical protein